MTAALFQPFPMVAGRRAQVWRHQPQFRRPRHFHEEPELNIVVAGHGVMAVGDRRKQVSAGDVLLFQPGQDHVLIEASSDFDLFVMALRPELAARAHADLAIPSAGALRLGRDELARAADELAGLQEVSDAASHELRISELFKAMGARSAAPHVLSRRALHDLRAEPGLSGSRLAQRFRTTPSAVSRRFHDDLGVTLVEYRSRIRLIKFVSLVDRGYGFMSAAHGAGFGSYAQCHRVFRRVLGCAPLEYFGGRRERIAEATF